MPMKNKILVLSDIDSSTKGILTNALNLAKIVAGEVTLFCVKRPTDIVENDSQLSAMRIINEKFLEIENKIKSVISVLSNDEKIRISHKISFGNLKDEISKQIKATKPDIIVLGKHKSKIFSFLGDNIIDFVLKEFAGTVMITSDKITVKADSELSLGLLNENKNLPKNRFKKTLVSFALKPLKSFQIHNNNAFKNKEDNPEKIIEYIFEEGDNALKNIDNYLVKNKIQLLFVPREKNKIGNLANHINCSLMLTN
jgi:nucleotide-binding universal stress UspA family protein